MSDLIIGLSGYARSGKNESANVLITRGWRPAAFADKLREVLLAVDPVIPGPYGTGNIRLSVLIRDVGWEYAKDHYPEVRALLHRVGTDAGRRLFGESVWVDALFRQHDDTSALVVTDVRFPNEAGAVRDRGGLVIRVTRPGIGPAKDKYGRVYGSEVALDDYDFDHILVNDGSIADLHKRLAGVANLIAPLAHAGPSV
ncbi:hypothetical protein [Streptomyces sp. NRRL F-5123]|uniref:deoxynucleotide monophosphate kinase family protein n=1 Tax=Streptomyces sp. NRRL F-5123 TaxID=1463856 RepID=UPI0004E1B87B|nr:hypothetical protein [Streptomyces sp. NRRL F-5123]